MLRVRVRESPFGFTLNQLDLVANRAPMRVSKTRIAGFGAVRETPLLSVPRNVVVGDLTASEQGFGSDNGAACAKSLIAKGLLIGS